MKNIQLSLLLFLCLLNSSLFAQFSFGLKAGTNFSTSYGTPEKLEGQNIEAFNLGAGYQFGLQTHYAFNEHFGLIGELNLERRIGKQSIEANQAVEFPDIYILVNRNTSLNNKLTYLNLPLLANYKANKVSIYAGPNVAYLLNAKAEIYDEVYFDQFWGSEGAKSQSPTKYR